MNLPFQSVGVTEALLLLRNLAVALKAGVPLARALKIFEEDANRVRKPLLKHLRNSVEQGNTLAKALETAPRRFPDIAVNLVRTGEIGGTLAESLEAAVTHLRKMQELKRKIRSAMMYPTFVLVAIVGLGISIGTLVLPKLIPLFETLDVALPWTTRLLLKTATFLEVYGVMSAILFVLILLILFLLTRLESVKPFWHRLLLIIPLVGNVQRKAAAAQISAALGALLGSGIPIRVALPAAAQATENRAFRSDILTALPVLESGRTLAEGLRSAGNSFPAMMTTLIDIGEETGTLTETLAYLAEYYDAEVDYAVKNLTTSLEPILLIVVGALVGGVVLAIITPIYDVTSSIR